MTTTPKPHYWGWSDPDPKKSDDRKVAEARARYRERFGREPSEVLERAPGVWWLGPVARETRA